MISTLEFQKAVFAQLSLDATLTALIPATSIVDAADHDGMPVLRIGDITEGNADLTYDQSYTTLIANFHCFTKETGKIANAEIMKRVRTLMESGFNPTMTGFNMCGLRFDTVRFMRDADDSDICHGVLSYDILMEATE